MQNENYGKTTRSVRVIIMNFKYSFSESPRFLRYTVTVKIRGLYYRVTFHRNYYVRAPFSRRADYIKYNTAHAYPAYSNACVEALVCAIHSAIYFVYLSFGATTCEIYTLYNACTYM